MARLRGRKAINRLVSGLPEVQQAVHDAAKSIERKASDILAAHRDEGHAKIELSRVPGRYRKRDYQVSLVDDAAVSIEYGHWYDSGDIDDPVIKYVPGLYIIHRAAGLL